MTLIAKNIRHLRHLRKLTQEQLADDLDITRSRVSSYEESRSEPPIELLIQLSEFFNLPVDVLIKNDLSKSDSESFLDIGNQRILFPIIVDKEQDNYIEVVPVKASAGYTRGFSDPEYIASLPTMKLPFVPVGKHRAFPISGDSMEPLVKDGAMVVGRYVESLQELRDGQTYIVVASEGFSYKRVDTSCMDQGYLILKSDNPYYPPFSVKLEEIKELWQFTCQINLNDYQEEDLNVSSIMSMMRQMQIELKEIKAQMK